MKNDRFRKDERFQRDNSNQDVIERKSGGGCLAVFGLPFFLAGLAVLLTGLGLGPIPVAGGLPSRVAAVIFGIIFTAVGGVLVFGRQGLIIDRRQNRVVQWQGLVVPLRRTVHPLDRFCGVRLDCLRGDKTTTYPVRLKGESPAGDILIEQPADYPRARQTAEDLARFIRKPLEDLSSGKPVIRDPDHLDESLRERVRRLGKDKGFFPPQPVSMRTRIEQTVDGVVLSIPGPKPGPGQLFPLAVSLVFAGFAAFIILPGLLSLPAPPAIHYIFGGFIVFFAVLMPILSTLRSLVRSRGHATRITATPVFLRIEEKTGGKASVVEIPADELEDLEFSDRRPVLSEIDVPGMKKLQDFGDTGTPRLPNGRPVPKILLAIMRMVPSQGITARSDRAAITFGKGLPEDELTYLHALIRKILTD